MKKSFYNPALLFCAALSCAAHAGVLVMMTDTLQPPLHLTGQPLQIALLPAPMPAPIATTAEAQPSPVAATTTAVSGDTFVSPKRQVPAQTAVKPEAIVTRSQSGEQTNKAIAHLDEPIAEPAHIPDSSGYPDDSLQVQLQSMLAASFSYPALAQRRNWQGEVRLGLRVEADGQLSNIRIIKSSGYTILDRAALRSLEQIATLPDIGSWLHGRHFDTVLPVEYRLIDS